MRGLTQSIGIVVACTLGVGTAVAIGSDSGADGLDARAAGTLPNSLTINGVSFKHGRANRTLTINGVAFKGSSAGKTLTINGTAFKRSGQTLTINGTAFKPSRGGTLTINGVPFDENGPTIPPAELEKLRGPKGETGAPGAAGPAGSAGPAPVAVVGPVDVQPGPAVELASTTVNTAAGHRLLITAGLNLAGSGNPMMNLTLNGTTVVARRLPVIGNDWGGGSASEIIVTPTVCGPCTLGLALTIASPGGGPPASASATAIRLGVVDLGPVQG